MNDRMWRIAALVALLLIANVMAASGSVTAQDSPSTPDTSSSPVATGSPVALPPECRPSADGLVLPVASNPISNPSTTPGLKIEQVLVENNVDPATGKDAPDHLEILLVNESDQEMSDFVVYYEITDLTTGDKEGYCSELTGFTIAAGEQRSVHFDNTGEKDHFPDNEFSLYRSSLNEMQVDVTVSATGFEPQTATVKKDAGGDEDPND